MADEGTLERLLREREGLLTRVKALDADIRAGKEQRRDELLAELAAPGLSEGTSGEAPHTGLRATPLAARRGLASGRQAGCQTGSMPSMSPRSFGLPMARLLRMKDAMPMKSTGTSPKG